MAKVCAGCGAMAGDEKAFCGGCGRALEAAPPAGYVSPSGQGYPPVAPPQAPPVQSYGQQGYAQQAPPPQAPPVQGSAQQGSAQQGSAQQGSAQQGYAPVQSGYPPAAAAAYPAAAYGAGYVAAPVGPKKSGSAMKWVVVILLFLGFVGVLGVAGVWYVAHRVKQKIAEVSGPLGVAMEKAKADAEAGGAPAPEGGGTQPLAAASGADAPILGSDKCKLLSKEEVSAALGVTVTDAVGTETGCDYWAVGKPRDLWAQHLALSPKAEGDEASQQNDMFTAAEGSTLAHDPRGVELLSASKSDVLFFSIDESAGQTEMQMDGVRLAIAGKYPPVEDLAVGDGGFEFGRSAMMVRKGGRHFQVWFPMCACTGEAVLPLAKKLAGEM